MFQKTIGISEEVRRKLGEAAVRAARAVNYVGKSYLYFKISLLFSRRQSL